MFAAFTNDDVRASRVGCASDDTATKRQNLSYSQTSWCPNSELAPCSHHAGFHLPGAAQSDKTRHACLSPSIVLTDPQGESHAISEVGKCSVATMGTPTPRQSAPGTGQWPVAAGWTDLRWPVPPFQASCCFLVGWWGSLPLPQLVY